MANLVFYFWAAVLLILGVVVVILALRLPTAEARPVSRRSTVAALFQDRLAELRREVAGGQAEPEDHEVLEEELSAALLDDYRKTPDAADAAGGVRSRWQPTLVIGAAGLLVAVVVLVYAFVGDPQAMRIAGAESVLGLDPAKEGDALHEWRARLVERVDGHPDEARSWYLLGHADLKLGYFATAAEAFSMAHQAHGEDPSIDVFWLQARYLAAGGQIDPATQALADRVLTRDPNQPLALEMLAIGAYQRGAYRESVSLLNRALSGALETDHRIALAAGYREARKRLGDLAPAVDVEVTSESPVPAGATLFVIARPVKGGMPFAVVRRPAGDLPRTIRLDDAVSMNPAAPLSSADAVEIVVRFSRSGTAAAHPGDWEWRSGPVALNTLSEPLPLSASLQPPGA